MLEYLVSRFKASFDRFKKDRVLDIFPEGGGEPKGDVLFSYLPAPVLWASDDKRFHGHSNVWESAEIVRVFNRLGYRVDAIHWKDENFVPRKKYAAIFDIHRNLSRYASAGTKKIFYVTGSNPAFSNREELRRLEQLRVRRGVRLKARRSISRQNVGLFERNLSAADLIVLIGNEVTKETFPADVHHIIRQSLATGSYLGRVRDLETAAVGKEFLWFNGGGAVHKGLDLTLEVFARHPELTLHVVGLYKSEKDFVKAYVYELNECANIFSHGPLDPAGDIFRKITENVIGFIGPSCSEGISTSAITCMQCGMVPILSRNSGISLPTGIGYLLEDCSLEAIEKAVLNLSGSSSHDIRRMMIATREYAADTYSREAFSARLESILSSVV